MKTITKSTKTALKKVRNLLILAALAIGAVFLLAGFLAGAFLV